MKIVIGLLALLAAITCPIAMSGAFADDLTVVVDPSSVGLSPERLAQVGSWYQDRVTSGDLPGAVIAVARNGKLAYLTAIGFQDHAKQIPMREDSIFWIESMTAPITCAAIMILVEDGKIDLDAAAAHYLPELGNMKVGVIDPTTEAMMLVAQERAMTVRDLLRQTSGLPSIDSGPAIAELYRKANLYQTESNLAGLVLRLSKLPLAHQPGEVWGSTGTGYDVLARLIEVASGQSFEDFLVARIFNPLRMTDTGFYVPAVKFGRVVQAPPGQRPFVMGRRPWFTSGAAGLASTAADYLRFAQMLLNGGELEGTRILSPQSVQALTTKAIPPEIRVPDSVLPAANASAPGVGFVVRTDAETGYVPGSVGSYAAPSNYGSLVVVDPSEKFIIVELQVGQQYVNEARISNFAYRALPVASTPLQTSGVAATITQFDGYSGKYYFAVSAAAKRDGPAAASDGFGGVGIVHRPLDGYEVQRVLDGSPASQAGVKAGDIITEVDGVSIKGLPLGEIARRIRGPANTQVRLKVSREGESKEFTLTRAALFVPPMEFEIRREGDKLVGEITGRWPFLDLERGKPLELTATSQGDFVLSDDDHTHVSFTKDAGQKVTGLILNSGPMAMRGVLLSKSDK